MSLRITDLHAVEILDSRARPTLAVTLTTSEGGRIHSAVHSGASTGSMEAVELRDTGRSRYGGQGVLTAVGNVNGEIAQALTSRTFSSAAAVDRALIALDGTDDKARLGANAITGVSLVATRAEAARAVRRSGST